MLKVLSKVEIYITMWITSSCMSFLWEYMVTKLSQNRGTIEIHAVVEETKIVTYIHVSAWYISYIYLYVQVIYKDVMKERITVKDDIMQENFVS